MTDSPLDRRSALRLMGAIPLAATGLTAAAYPAHALPASSTPTPPAGSGAYPELNARINEIMGRDVFQGARWGMTFHVPGAAEAIYRRLGDELFPAGSTVKYFLSAIALAALGPTSRFRTDVHRTGPISRGVLHGDLVVVAGGDLLMGGRVQSDGSLALPNPDHANNLPDATPLPGNPLRTLHLIARQVAAAGVRRITGDVLIDTSLFRPGMERIALGALEVPVTPIMINDNVIDVMARPGSHVGAPATLTVSPDIGYLRVTNQVTTARSSDAPAKPLAFSDDVTQPDGTHVVRLTGEVSLSRSHSFACYYLRDPALFAATAFRHALNCAGVRVDQAAVPTGPPPAPRPDHLVARHLSPPISEAVKVMSNIHSAYWPYLVGAIAGGDPETAEATGKAMQRRLQEDAGLDPNHPDNGRYTADYYVQFLTHVAGQSYFRSFHDLLAVMGRSGSLEDVQVDSPAAGHVFAKAGHVAGMSLGTALAGYIEPPGRPAIAFSQYLEKPQAPSDDMNRFWDTGTEAQGEVVTAVWEHIMSSP